MKAGVRNTQRAHRRAVLRLQAFHGTPAGPGRPCTAAVWRRAALYTDALLSYEGLEGDYAHKVVDHAVQYVDGRVHTNGLENFWSLLKRGINGTYISVEPFHLFRYLDEQAYRYNNRKLTDGERFSMAVSGIVGKRLTFDQLTGKDRVLDATLVN